MLSDEARNWKLQVGYIAKAEAREQNWEIPPKETKVVIEITAFWGDGRRHDMNNLHKLLCDALEGYFYIDDCKVLVRDMDFAIDRKAPRVECTLYPKDEVEP